MQHIELMSESAITADKWIGNTIGACLKELKLSEAQVASIVSLRLYKLLWRREIE